MPKKNKPALVISKITKSINTTTYRLSIIISILNENAAHYPDSVDYHGDDILLKVSDAAYIKSDDYDDLMTHIDRICSSKSDELVKVNIIRQVIQNIINYSNPNSKAASLNLIPAYEYEEACATGRKMQEEMTGRKFDEGKPNPFFVIQSFPNAFLVISTLNDFGRKKYTENGWQTVPDGFNRYSNAMTRHMIKESLEASDDETGLDHAVHVAWNALARLELKLREENNSK